LRSRNYHAIVKLRVRETKGVHDMKTKAAQPTKLIKKEQKDFFPNMRSIINKSGFVERTLAALKGLEVTVNDTRGTHHENTRSKM